MKAIRWPALISLIALTATAASASRVRVTADRVNLRAVSQSTAEVVAQVSTGDELQALSSIDGTWIQVVPPSKVDLWIFAELVQGGQVIVSKAQVRAGAGLNFNVVGTLRRGALVEERGRLGDWLKIAPPEGSALWVSRDYVEPVSEPVPEPPSPLPSPPVETIAPVQPIPVLLPPPPPPLTPRGEDSPPPDPRYPEIPSEPASDSPSPTHTEDVAALPAQDTALHPAPETASGGAGIERLVPPLPALVPAPAILPPPIPVPSAGWEQPLARTTPGRTADPAPQQRIRPRVLIPATDGAVTGTVGPANIPADRLSPRFQQGRPGRYEGQLSGAGAIFFTPGKYRLVAINQAGRAVTVCYVLGNERQLAALMGSRVAVEGSVYWFRSTQYPTIHAEKLQNLP